MTDVSPIFRTAIHELVLANRILDREGVVDALGHVSIRHPERPDRYLLSCACSPGLVTDDDILEFDLESRPIDPRDRPLFVERFIHGSIYKARADVNAICHNHALPLIPFSVTRTPIKPIWVMGAALGNEIRAWDVREAFPDDDGMLVVNDMMGAFVGCSAGHMPRLLAHKPWRSRRGGWDPTDCASRDQPRHQRRAPYAVVTIEAG